MDKNIYMLENTSKQTFDVVREYCKAEQVNEEYLRSCLEQKPKKRRKSIMKFLLHLLHIGF